MYFEHVVSVFIVKIQQTNIINFLLTQLHLIFHLTNYKRYIRFVIEKLGVSRVSKIKVVGQDEVEGSLYYQLVQGKGVLSSLDDKIAKETQKAGMN